MINERSDKRIEDINGKVTSLRGIEAEYCGRNNITGYRYGEKHLPVLSVIQGVEQA